MAFKKNLAWHPSTPHTFLSSSLSHVSKVYSDAKTRGLNLMDAIHTPLNIDQVNSIEKFKNNILRLHLNIELCYLQK